MYTIKDSPRGLVSHGVSTCSGCGLELAMRVLLDVLGKKTVIVIPPGCAALFSGYGNETTLSIPGVQGNLENTAAVAAGIRAGFKYQGKEDITVLGMAGDGATADIGLQALSGAFERGDKILYVCYDNEAYMNTGIQASSSSPLYAWTTTTPTGKPVHRKNLMQIIGAHSIPYAATASLAYIEDFRKKIKKAKASSGPAFLHVHIPCPTGWGYDPAKSIELAKLAVTSRCWNLYELLNGREIKISKKIKKPKPVKTFLETQKRFAGVSDEDLDAIQAQIDSDYVQLERLAAIQVSDQGA